MGNFDIYGEQKISFVNEMKQNKIWSTPKGWVQKNLSNITSNFGKGRNKSCWKYRPFCMASMKVSEMQQTFIKNFKTYYKIVSN